MKSAIITNTVIFIVLLLTWVIDSQTVTALVGIAMWVMMAVVGIGLTASVLISVGISTSHVNAPSLEDRISLAQAMCKGRTIPEIMVSTISIVPSLIMMQKLGMDYQAYAWAGFVTIGAHIANIIIMRNANNFLSHN